MKTSEKSRLFEALTLANGKNIWIEDIEPEEEPEEEPKVKKPLTEQETLEQEERDLDAQYALLVTNMFNAKHKETPVYSKPTNKLTK